MSVLSPSPSHRVVVIGGGFGGIQAARGLRRAPAEITLIDRRNFHLFQPLLYQVATGGLSPANIAAPLRKILSRQENCRVWLGEVGEINVNERWVACGDTRIPYDTLVVAAGATHSYFGHDEWETHAPGLKTLEDATAIRGKVLLAFETAEKLEHSAAQAPWLTFIVVGGGPTGVELAGSLAEIARHTLKRDFRNIDPASARILLVEAADRVLGTFPPDLSQKAEQALSRLGVTLLLKHLVTDIGPDRVTLKCGDITETIFSQTILWAAGVTASPLAKSLAQATGADLDRAGRIIVQPDLSLPRHPEIFVIGDMAHCAGADGKPLPGVAPVAMQQGSHVARQINARLRGIQTLPFRYHNKGNLATIGRSSAVADFGWLKLSGFVAWMLWLTVHLMFIVTFRNRLLVLVQWGWSYVTWDRSARLITGSAQDDGDAPHKA